MLYTVHKASLKNINILVNLFNEYTKLITQKDNIKSAYSVLYEHLSYEKNIIYFSLDDIKKTCCGFIQVSYNFNDKEIFLVINSIFIDYKYENEKIKKSLLEAIKNYASLHNYNLLA